MSTTCVNINLSESQIQRFHRSEKISVLITEDVDVNDIISWHYFDQYSGKAKIIRQEEGGLYRIEKI